MSQKKNRYEKIGEKLMEVLWDAYCEGIAQFIIEEIEKAVENLDLPNKRCERCGREMSFFDYHWLQGLCNQCHAELSEEYYEEDE